MKKNIFGMQFWQLGNRIGLHRQKEDKERPGSTYYFRFNLKDGKDIN